VLASYASLVALEMREKSTDSQITDDLDKIAFEAKRIANLIDSMKSMSFPKTQKTELNIGELSEQTARLYHPILKRAGINLAADIPAHLPPVFGSPDELTQVIFNLFQNAKNNTTIGEIAIKLSIVHENLQIVISDTGQGIVQEKLTNIFERGVTGEDGGSGIGLALCKEIIEDHKGEISIESELGKGTTVTFSLPIYKGNKSHGN